jgi:hypothetical protein
MTFRATPPKPVPKPKSQPKNHRPSLTCLFPLSLAASQFNSLVLSGNIDKFDDGVFDRAVDKAFSEKLNFQLTVTIYTRFHQIFAHKQSNRRQIRNHTSFPNPK